MKVYFFFEDNPRNVRSGWQVTTPPAVGDEVQLWSEGDSDKTCIVTRRRWSGTNPIVVDVFVKVVPRSEVG